MKAWQWKVVLWRVWAAAAFGLLLVCLTDGKYWLAAVNAISMVVAITNEIMTIDKHNETK